MGSHLEPQALMISASSNRITRLSQSSIAKAAQRLARWHPESRPMAPRADSPAVIAARSEPGGGAIAGAVVGSIFGVIVLAIVLGFLYFRWKRQSRPEAAGDGKSAETERRLSLPGPDQSSGQPRDLSYSSTWNGDAQFDDQVPEWATRMDYSQQAIPGQPRASDSPITGGGLHARQHANSAQDDNGTSSPLDVEDRIDENEWAPPTDGPEGGAADYYNTNIVMDSGPELAPTGPTRQMTELYEEQIKKSRAHRQNSKGSTWSRFTKGLMSKRKRSTRMSEIAMEEGQARPSSPSHPDVAIASIEGPSGKTSDRGIVPDSEIFEEPLEMSDSSHVDMHTHKRAKRRGPSGDVLGTVPHRLDSLQTEPTLDSQLPSSAFRQKWVPSDTLAARQATRFQSPELPEPMEVDDNDFVAGEKPAAVRGSHSPPLNVAGFSAVNPMDIMRPSNAAEKAVYTNAELTRLTSTSVSPPTSPPYNATPPPETQTHQDVTEPDSEEGENADDESDSDEEEANHAQGFEIPPRIAIDEAFVTDGPSDWSTPAGTTLTNASSGRTPSTEITSSPSPPPVNGLKPDGNLSPPDSTASPKHVLTCEECGRTFDQIHKLNHHKRYHDRKHICHYEECGKKFGTKTHLDRHINDKHEKKKGFHCTQEGCQYFRGGKSFPRKDNWRRHMLNKHGITPTTEPQAAE